LKQPAAALEMMATIATRQPKIVGMAHGIDKALNIMTVPLHLYDHSSEFTVSVIRSRTRNLGQSGQKSRVFYGRAGQTRSARLAKCRKIANVLGETAHRC
jgi:hypothetical protein